MRIEGLVKTLEEMTDDELLEKLRQTRHNRTVGRPVAKRKAERTERKAANKRLSAAEKMLAGMSDADKAELIKQLSNGESDDPAGNDPT